MDGVGCGNWGGIVVSVEVVMCVHVYYVYASWPVQSVCAMYEEGERVRVGVSE